ncbi:5-methyltetrahydropteroyltriglutamate--homocysteine S-methyltransferase [Thaumasiovibrio sp. DFM-14]|uniref:5-methyltetrahydropteroyltriglutamate-- homocysteine S-methyltransferase n=1 Tax=Thaumasiovibrio sp. DFM-14 TaxID=3384792 RepID=UPI0039A24AD0
MTTTHILGYPRIGAKRELKFALESYWQGDIDQKALNAVAASLRATHWKDQAEAGLEYVTVGDFAWYDHVLTTSLMLGNIPRRHANGHPDLDTLFRIARGRAKTECGCAAADMTKWFNTNYHYIVPEFEQDTQFSLSWHQLFEEIAEAQQQGHKVKPVLLGPLSYLWLGVEKSTDFDRLTLLPRLLAAYQQIIQKLVALNIDWVQIDEPILALDLPQAWRASFKLAYQVIRGDIKVLLTTYFDDIATQLDIISTLAIDGLHVDLVSAPKQLNVVVETLPSDWVLSVGVVNGRNVWRSDLSSWYKTLAPLQADLGERLWIGSSCSLLHSPIDLESEEKLDKGAKSWFAFAKQKLSEITLLADALNGKRDAIAQCHAYSASIVARRSDEKVHNSNVQARLRDWNATLAQRSADYPLRAQAQQQALNLPTYPTTTIGSFPQTSEIRQQRRQFKAGQLSEMEYNLALRGHIKEAIQRQEKLELDVLVHGEAERNDMVEYFAELLDGFISTQFGWVQSYGSRCVKPAVVVGDISRPAPMTVEWSAYAQSLTDKKVKGMLTGPVTILGWTFPREDISRQHIAAQIALALRDEVADLQAAGINIIQIDEPAIREGLPLKRAEWQAYLDWAVESFKVSAGSAVAETQIHTHMCYSDFNDIIEAIAALDADVITIETSRSDMALLNAFEVFEYPNAIGPGVYDIHSPNIPTVEQMVGLIEKAGERIPKERLWVNPDCGLKTRNWEETEAALRNMVSAAKQLRQD